MKSAEDRPRRDLGRTGGSADGVSHPHRQPALPECGERAKVRYPELLLGIPANAAQKPLGAIDCNGLRTVTSLAAPKHVFISYARSDGYAAAQELNQFLQANSIATWQDVRDLDPYQDFSAEIETAIEAAMHVVVCLTPSIVERKDSFVRREIIYAQGVGRQLARSASCSNRRWT
jgi:hypothetical protein